MSLSDKTKAIIEIVAFIVLAIVGFILYLLDKTLPLMIVGVVEMIISYVIGRTFVWPKLPNTARSVSRTMYNAIEAERKSLDV